MPFPDFLYLESVFEVFWMNMVVTAVGTLSGFFIIEGTFKIWINVIFILVQKQDFLYKISYDKGFSSCFDRHLSRLAVQIAFVQILIVGAFLARTGCKHVFQININLSQLLDLYFFHKIFGCKTRKSRNSWSLNAGARLDAR